ncbi:hypothetical protein ELG72_24915 [Rhizobium leguminosarum]|uniref:hypothetical protein n=1 Tax=Rhizobium leguminosarum TaxID=384 RepID=UPI001030502B|nr:hypothetical protein [Rhizobium leguminosarum]TBG66102.1 hypothetical protein ELG72_24915 [Rhizobium leguminosarum]
MKRQLQTPSIKKPSKAKALRKEAKRGFVLNTYRTKVERMEDVYERSKAAKQIVDWWPETLEEFREWDDPEKGIFKFSDPTKTSPNCPDEYRPLHHRLKIVKGNLAALKAALEAATPPETTASLKAIIAAQSEQITKILMLAVQFRDEIARISPKSKYLKAEWDIY